MIDSCGLLTAVVHSFARFGVPWGSVNPIECLCLAIVLLLVDSVSYCTQIWHDTLADASFAQNELKNGMRRQFLKSHNRT
jgi:hypothetical protein